MAFTATIPSAEGNPFVSVTSLPEGTLFIVFGSILLGIFVLIVAWRVWTLWASHRAATNNEARFTAVDSGYGGPFVDPVAQLDEDEPADEKAPRLHPVGVPLSLNPRTKPKKSRPKSQAERVREAQLQGRFFSPTVEVLTHGTALPPGAGAASSRASFLPSGYYGQQHSQQPSPSLMSAATSQAPPPDMQNSRLSVQQTGRNSIMQHSAMSSDTLPVSGVAPQPRGRKLRPPSAYLDDLIG